MLYIFYCTLSNTPRPDAELASKMAIGSAK